MSSKLTPYESAVTDFEFNLRMMHPHIAFELEESKQYLQVHVSINKDPKLKWFTLNHFTTDKYLRLCAEKAKIQDHFIFAGCQVSPDQWTWRFRKPNVQDG